MANDVESVDVRRYSGTEATVVRDIVAREAPLTVVLNDNELVTLLCSPDDQKNLAIGFLSSEGLISRREEIQRVVLDEARGVVRIEVDRKQDQSETIFKRFISSGCGRGASFYSAADIVGMAKVDSAVHISSSDLSGLFRQFQVRSRLFRETGGVHSAALCNNREIVLFAEDVGRHNAVDKIFGKCLMEDIPTDGLIVLTSGRISSEILLKVARRSIPVLASKSAPTDIGVKLAIDLGITLVGFVRGNRMNVYSNDWRLQ